MSYNIERGFHSRDHILEEHRLQAAQRIIQQVQPDILALTEACYGGSNSHGIKMDYQQLFQFPYGEWSGYRVFGPRHGDEGGNALLSQFPLQAEVIQFSHKGAIRGYVNLENRILTVDVVHPSYQTDDQEKIVELASLVKSRKESLLAKYLYILTGDFNTLHPDDIYDYDELAKEFAEFDQQKVKKMLDNWKKAECVSWILAQGLQDAFPPESRQSTVPTCYAYGRKQKGVRLDFTFHTPDLVVKEAYVLKNDDTEIASDHYPIVCVFEI
ncbi:MAG: endonuclease/exonuclease/phosphatase family protein [Nanoarchaeota archaeon]|nr:endonuclease/exonuclease/phosphatase family protein [Nanoarchaeota archaeon]